jgi:hypothetical protein
MAASTASQRDRLLPISGVVFVLVYFAVAEALAALPLAAGGRLAVTILPLVAFLWFLGTAVRVARGLDELERRIQLEALAVAYPTAIALLMAFALLDRAGFVVPGFERMRDLALLAMLPYPIGVMVAKRRYS